MRNAEVNPPAFFRSSLFIVLPLFLLAGLGLYFLGQDRSIAAAEASARCAPLADLLARDIAEGLVEAPNAIHSISMIDIASNGDLIAIGGSSRKAHAVECPQPLSSGEPTPAQALYDLALAEKSPSLFRDVETNRRALSAAGLPLWLLAEYQRLQINPSPADATTLCSNAVNYPSFITPAILAHAPPHIAAPWLEMWNADENARSLYATARPKLPSSRPFSIEWRGQGWLISSIFGVTLRPASDEIISNVVFRAIHRRQSTIPSYAEVAVQIAGRNIRKNSDGFPTLVGSFGDLPDTPLNLADVVHVRLLLAQPDLLFAQQRRRVLWFAALIIASALAAVIALLNSHRAFRQQVLLSEMKSNFVSSVSHELRAPVASMRLLAEGLDRGKISDPPKQREYFKLLAQESRRLSTLIENILDYSRIGQGRKTYEKEPTDLPALVAQTVALLSVAAAERRVSLVAPTTAPDFDPVVHCDGLAIRQALVNLIDNAVKHSSPDSTVTISLARNGQTVSLSVEDHGPGIPVDEREKIFERFYRRGPELRRETQGIGIGLTIVKHIIEAHGGRVLVSGEVGRGSRFTLEWPANA